jgi:hypothetical protein
MQTEEGVTYSSWYSRNPYRSPYYAMTVLFWFVCLGLAIAICLKYGNQLGFELTLGFIVPPCFCAFFGLMNTIFGYRGIHELYLTGQIEDGKQNDTLKAIEVSSSGSILSAGFISTMSCVGWLGSLLFLLSRFHLQAIPR